LAAASIRVRVSGIEKGTLRVIPAKRRKRKNIRGGEVLRERRIDGMIEVKTVQTPEW